MKEKQYLPSEDNINKVRSLDYYDVEIKIYVEPLTSVFGCTSNMYTCGLNGCKDFIGGSSQTKHLIEKHTVKETLQYLGLLKKDD